MKTSYKIGSVWGIPIEIHLTFLLLMVAVFVLSYPDLYLFILILFLFVFVVTHELSHSIVAKHYKIPVKKIVLYPIGGVSEIEEIPENPRIEWRMAIAGPMASFIVGLILIAAYIVANGSITTLITAITQLALSGNITLDLGYLNVVLGAFNLIPAFPMDGGRVLRALLAERFKFTDATRYAANIGRILGIVMAVFGIFYNFWLVIIGVFVYMGASEEAESTILSSTLAKVRVRDVMHPEVVVVKPESTVGEAMETMFKARYHDALVERDGVLQGVVCWDQISKVKIEERNLTPIMQLPLKKVVANPDESVLEAYKILAREKIHLLPVVEKENPDKIVGVITNDDITYAMEKAKAS